MSTRQIWAASAILSQSLLHQVNPSNKLEIIKGEPWMVESQSLLHQVNPSNLS
jgi:hypothetical protein